MAKERLIIVNTLTGERALNQGRLKRGVICWAPGFDQHGPRAGLSHGDERLVTVTEQEDGSNGSVRRVKSEAWDGQDAWVVTYERFDPVRGLDVIANELLSSVEARKHRRYTAAGVDTGLGWDVDWRHDIDERNIAGMVDEALDLKMAGETAAVLQFRGADDVVRDLTPELMIQVGRKTKDYVSALYAAGWAHEVAIAALLAAEDREGLEDYDVGEGWPE